jgi:hypothetical protein
MTWWSACSASILACDGSRRCLPPLVRAGYAQIMNTGLPPPPEPGLPDHPEPLPPARGRGFLAERLLSINSVVSVIMLGWSVAVLRRPSLLRAVLRAARRSMPWLLAVREPRESRGDP